MKKLLNTVLQQAQQADVLTHKSSSLGVQFENSKLKDISAADSYQTRLRAIKDGRMGVSTTTKPGGDDTIVDYALATAQFGKEIKYSLPGASETASPNVYDKKVVNFKEKEMIDIGQELVEAITTFDSKVRVNASVEKEEDEVELLNSEGFHDSYKQTAFSVFVQTELVEGQNMLFCYDVSASTHLEYDLGSMKSKIINDIRLARNIVDIEPGEYPVIFTPVGQFMSLASVLSACINGKAVAKGISPWKGRLGEEIFCDKITLINDGIMDKGVASARFDTEGVPCRRLALIENGVLKNYLLDLETAQQLGMEPTGTGSGNGPMANNLILASGDRDFASMLKSIDKGILIEQTMGAWAGNPYGGQVSGNISLGYKIENGEIVGRIKNAMFSVNVFEAFKHKVAALSKETKTIAFDNQCAILPHLLLDDVNISVKQ